MCYEEVDQGVQYHPTCLKKLFNSEQLPDFSFSSKDIGLMALEQIKEKRGLPGVQKKLSLALEEDKKNKSVSRLTMIGYLGGEYILKPPTSEYPQMPEIEDLTMHMAEIADISVAPHGLIQMDNAEFAYITKRFDRDGANKFAVEDLCQLSLKLTEQKYKSSYESIGKIIRTYSKIPGDDILRFFELVLFSFVVGNADMHLKNFSMITQIQQKIRLSPCYDLLSTKLLIPEHNDPEELALPLNGKKSNFRRKDFLVFGKNLKIPDKVIEYAISNMISNHAKWETKINQSFLSATLKAQLKELLKRNLNRIA